MIKGLLGTLGMTVLALSVVAQSLVVIDYESVVMGLPSDATLLSPAKVVNTSGSEMSVKVKFFENSLVTDAGHFFCWAVCYIEGAVNNGFESPHALTIPAGDTVPNFYSDYKPHNTSGISHFTYCFYDENNMSDSSCIDLRFDTQTLGIEDASQLTDLVAYPNPADNEMTIKYNLRAGLKSPKIEVYDVLGSKVRSKDIEDESGKFVLETMDLPSGMYFYKLKAEGTDLALRKFMVSH